MKNLKSAILLIAIFTMAYPFAISAQTNSAKTNVAIIQGIYIDFATGNVPGVLGALDAKVEWNEAESFIYGDNKPFIGPDAVVNGVFAKIGGEWDGFTIANLQIHNMDNGMVLATGRYQAKYKKNGVAIDAQMAHLWTLKDGKIMKFQQYTDTKQFAEAVKK
jgi:uncharacterized protein